LLHGAHIEPPGNLLGCGDGEFIAGDLCEAAAFKFILSAVDKGQLEPLHPNMILRALEESIARRFREGRIWPSLPRQFWIKTGVGGQQPSYSREMRRGGSR
jgi:hypothetical protein